jgi:hypothetical protein
MKNVTFLIGNGFDLNLGLKTRYVDMYEGYVNSPSADSDIAKLKELLKADAPGYETWGDFEMAMARHAAKFDSADIFVNCVRDFRKYLSECLTGENSKFLELYKSTSDAARICTDEFDNSLRRFFRRQTPNVTNAIEQSLASLNGVHYNFIVFNYTTILDHIIGARRARGSSPSVDVVHIHGRIGTDVVLGIDNANQLEMTPYAITNKLERTFVKPYFNQSYDNARFEKAIGMICDSNVICVYGMALGESDRMWIDALIQWLKADEENHLVYFAYSEKDYSGIYPDEVMDDEDELKLQLLNRICTDVSDVSAVINRVHIPIGQSLFDFSQKLQNPPTSPRTMGSMKSM